MKNIRKELIDELKGKKKFMLYWVDTTSKSVEIEATSKEEAEEMFFEGSFNWLDVEDGDSDYNDDSLEIEEVEK